MKKVIFLSLVAALLLSGAFSSLQARPATASTPKILEFDTLAGVPRPYTGAANAIRGLPGGGLPWVVGSAFGELKTNGVLEIQVNGLVIDPNDPAAIASGRAGTNPSPTFRAVVSCQTIDSAGAATVLNLATAAFPATPTGNAAIEATLALPHPCLAPIVFVTNGAGTAWFAATGIQ